MAKKSAIYHDYDIVVEDNNSITIMKNGVQVANAKSAIREIAAEIGFELKETSNTRQAGSKLVDFINAMTDDKNVAATADGLPASVVKSSSVQTGKYPAVEFDSCVYVGFLSNLYDENGNVIADWNNEEYEKMPGGYTKAFSEHFVILSNGEIYRKSLFYEGYTVNNNSTPVTYFRKIAKSAGISLADNADKQTCIDAIFAKYGNGNVNFCFVDGYLIANCWDSIYQCYPVNMEDIENLKHWVTDPIILKRGYNNDPMVIDSAWDLRRLILELNNYTDNLEEKTCEESIRYINSLK